MPELPEVETVVRGLSGEVTGKVFENITLFRPNLRFPFPQLMEERVGGKHITAIRRRAKYILIDLDSGETLLVHLGMSGQLLFTDPDAYEQAKHDHVLFELSDGRMLRYHDPRRFGFMELVDTASLQSHALFSHLGPEPLEMPSCSGGTFDAAYLSKVLATRKGPIKPALMDQKLVVGVGNIYACEALYLAGVHPKMPANMLGDKTQAMVDAIRHVLLAAIESGGSTLRDFVRSTGDSGYFQHAFQVYGRTDAPCFACETPISQLKQAGRSTFYCSTCQPAL